MLLKCPWVVEIWPSNTKTGLLEGRGQSEHTSWTPGHLRPLAVVKCRPWQLLLMTQDTAQSPPVKASHVSAITLFESIIWWPYWEDRVSGLMWEVKDGRVHTHNYEIHHCTVGELKCGLYFVIFWKRNGQYRIAVFVNFPLHMRSQWGKTSLSKCPWLLSVFRGYKRIEKCIQLETSYVISNICRPSKATWTLFTWLFFHPHLLSIGWRLPQRRLWQLPLTPQMLCFSSTLVCVPVLPCTSNSAE